MLLEDITEPRMLNIEEESTSKSLSAQADSNDRASPVETSIKLCYDYYRNSYDFLQEYNLALFVASTRAWTSFLNVGDQPLREAQNMMRGVFNTTLGERLNSESFASSLGSTLDSWARLAGFFNYFQATRNLSDFLSYISGQFEPLRDTLNRSASEVIEMEGRFNLLHYKSKVQQKQKKAPILVIYSLINRHYLLDLLPKFSVISNLLNQGFDVYATDWGTPTSYDKDLTVENYAEEYVGYAVEKISELTGSEKVSLLGYCWGGIFALIYSATHPEKVKTLILHATPIDIKKEETVIENWTAHVNADVLVRAFGNVPGWILNLAFLLRNPVEAVLKYPRYFSQPRSLNEIIQFFAIETWLYDSPPIIGEVYREIVDQIYKENLLVKNKMMVGTHIVDLAKIAIPVLDIVGLKDDLVPPQASRSVIDIVASKDKKLMEFPTGHVGLCVSPESQEKLWPEVGRWLAQRS